ncbi:MAG: hypothetical protein ABI333_14420 [bacterium]
MLKHWRPTSVIALFIALSILLLTAASCEGSDPGPTEVTGYWVWVRTVEDGATVQTITDADMEPKVGPSGWPDCPSGILCTRYGIHKVAFGDSGRIHYGFNVNTSSDYQTLGTFSAADGVGQVIKEVRFSCAHPGDTNSDAATTDFVYHFDGDELWLGVRSFSGFELPLTGTPETAPTRYIVFKQVTREDYYGKYMIRICQASGGDTCHDGCFDDTLVNESP